MRVLVWILSVTALAGCSEEGAVSRAGFRVAWSIVGRDNAPSTCDGVGAQQVTLVLTDAAGQRHRYAVPCEDYVFETRQWDAATGEALVEAALSDLSGYVVAEASRFSHVLRSGMLENVLPAIVFEVPPDDDGAPGPGVAVAWQLTDGAGLAACQSAGARFLTFRITDGGGAVHPLAAVPCQSFGQLEAGPLPGLAEGSGMVDAAVRNAAMETIAAQSVPVTIAGADLSPVFLDLLVSGLPDEGAASVLWRWHRNGADLDEERCDLLGIDRARLFVWHGPSASWVTDPEWMTAPCETSAHVVAPVYGSPEGFSGLFVSQRFSPGVHRFSLGLYRDALVAGGLRTEQLVQVDPRGSSAEGVVLSADDASLNRFEVDLGVLSDQGSLAITVLFETGDGVGFGECDAVDVSGMFARLTSEDGVAMAVELDRGVICRDRFALSDLPMDGAPYTLAVAGLTPDGRVGWHGVCEGLTPTLAGSEAARECRVSRLLPTSF